MEVLQAGIGSALHDEAMSAKPFSQHLETQAAAVARRQGPDLGIDPGDRCCHGARVGDSGRAVKTKSRGTGR